MLGTAKPRPPKGEFTRERYQRRQDRAAVKVRADRRERRKELAIEKQIRIDTFLRDFGRCRASNAPLRLASDNPFIVAHCHHFVYRSAGGLDEMFNRITLSPAAHQQEHDGLLNIQGEPNGTLYFTLTDKKGAIVRAWESTV